MAVSKKTPIAEAIPATPAELHAAMLATVADASSAQHAVTAKWLKAATAAWKAGTRLVMIDPGTVKVPNPKFDKGMYDAIRTAIITGVSASQKGMRFSTALPSAAGADVIGKADHVWHVSDLLALTRDQLREIDDAVLKTQRAHYKSMVEGTMFGLVRKYLDRIENPDKVRGAKGAGKADAAAPANDGPLWDRLAALLAEVNATCLTWKDDKGKSPKGLIDLQEAGLEMAANLGQVIKALKV